MGSATSTLADVARDARVAIRSLSRDRTFTATALLTLIVCLGANTAIFSIVRSVVLKPLPFENPDRIVLFANLYPKAGFTKAGPGETATSVPDYVDRLRETTVFSEQALYVRRNPTLGSNDGAQRVAALSVTPSFFRLLGARADVGRLFLSEDEKPDQDAKVVLSYGFWQREYGGDRSVVGRDIRRVAVVDEARIIEAQDDPLHIAVEIAVVREERPHMLRQCLDDAGVKLHVEPALETPHRRPLRDRRRGVHAESVDRALREPRRHQKHPVTL